MWISLENQATKLFLVFVISNLSSLEHFIGTEKQKKKKKSWHQSTF